MRREDKGEPIMTENEKEMIDKLVDEAEIILEEDYEKKDLKEKRGVTKQTLYDGSKKLKHTIPKGKQLK
jgi:Trp operon repressor